KRASLPHTYRQWSKVAWHALLKTLPDEADSPEIAEGAADTFRSVVSDLMGHMEALSYKRDQHERMEIQRRTLLSWCAMLAKPMKWGQVRSLALWCRRSANGQLEVAINQRLFAQVHRSSLAPYSHRRFAKLCQQYGIGQAGRTGQARFVEL